MREYFFGKRRLLTAGGVHRVAPGPSLFAVIRMKRDKTRGLKGTLRFVTRQHLDDIRGKRVVTTPGPIPAVKRIFTMAIPRLILYF